MMYSSTNNVCLIKSRRMRWVGHVEHIWGTGEVRTEFWWVDLREEPHVRPRHRWEDNNEMDLQEVELGGME